MEGEKGVGRKLDFGGDNDDDGGNEKDSKDQKESKSDAKGGGGNIEPDIALPMDKDDWIETKQKLSSFVSESSRTDTPWKIEPYCSDELVNACNLSSFDVKISPETYAVICSLALEIENINWARTSLYRPYEGKPVIISQRQAASILACTFLNLFPPPRADFEGQHLSFQNWKDETEKLRCIANYFLVIKQRLHDDPSWCGSNIGFYRRKLLNEDYSMQSDWEASEAPLATFTMVDGEEASIEHSKNTLQADFANEFIGGGVLTCGNVQEEIRFTIAPENFCSMLFCHVMGATESILMRGTEIYSNYTGYGWGFKFESTFTDDTEIDSDGFRNNWLVALDALPYSRSKPVYQYKSKNFLRDLQKCLVATYEWPRELAQMPTSSSESESKGPCNIGQGRHLQPFATGNWGCGVFGGDPELKSIQQWLACSVARRDIFYFNRRSSWPELQAIIDAINVHNKRTNNVDDENSAGSMGGAPFPSAINVINVGELSKMAFEFEAIKSADNSESFFTFLLAKIRNRHSGRNEACSDN